MDWLASAWDEVKTVAAGWVDHDNFQAELDVEKQVQLAEQRQAVTSQPVAPSGPGFMAQVQPMLPWIVGGAVLVFVAPKFLK